MAITQDAIASRFNPMAFVFQATDIPDAAGTANTVQATSPDYVMPWDGSIIAISARSNAAFTTGTVTFRPMVNGTANTGLTITLQSGTQLSSKTLEARIINFKAGDRLGMDWTKTGTVAPITNDVAATLFVVFEQDF